MTQEKKPVPAGYWMDATGALIPVGNIKPIDKARDAVVKALCESAKESQAQLVAFKLVAMDKIAAFISESLAQYDVAHGGKKGNVTLFSFDGRYKIVRQMQETLTFDERLQAAKALIDECIQVWSKGSNAHIKVLVNDAFQVDQQGKISTGRVLRLRSLDIKDEKWQLAMKAIGDSMRVASTKPYIRFYERDATTEAYEPISLDVAAI
jgi:hypothetical protein